jgi:hypothetical protein
MNEKGDNSRHWHVSVDISAPRRATDHEPQPSRWLVRVAIGLTALSIVVQIFFGL